MYILITAASSAEAHKLKNQLNLQNVILGDDLELPAFMKIMRLPNPKSMSYTHEMLTLCLDKGIDKIYALRDEEFSLLDRARKLFEEYGIEIIHVIARNEANSE